MQAEHLEQKQQSDKELKSEEMKKVKKAPLNQNWLLC